MTAADSATTILRRAGTPDDRRRLLLWGGLALSLFLHLTLAVFAGLFHVYQPPVGGEGGGTEIQMALLPESEVTSLIDSVLSSEVPGLTQIADPTLPVLESASGVPSPNFGTASVPLSGLGGSGGGLGTGQGFGPAVGGGSAKFFGVEARGARFAYIVDSSGSMVSERLAALKAELKKSINALPENSHCTVIIYNSQSRSLTNNRWLPADPRSKRNLSEAIDSIVAEGGTEPVPAFIIALSMRPRPDAIYFMTDGEFTPQVENALMTDVDRANHKGGRRTPIHCISLINTGAEQIMRRIARMSGGSYTHIASGGAP